MTRYCHEVLPDMLTEACEVDAGLAGRIGEDVLSRAEAFAALPAREQNVLIAPFIEEAFDHEPLDAPLELRAKVTFVVRNSLLEQAHHDGPLGSGIVPITTFAAGPLSHLLAARHRSPGAYDGPNPFAGLAQRYPRAWASLGGLTDVFASGGRQPVTMPDAPVPALPDDNERITAEPTTDGTATVLSAIDPRFDSALIAVLEQAAAEPTTSYVSALSRYSRNSEKLHRTLEYLLAHDATILTTNYLLRPTDVWVRRGDLVKPESRNPLKGFAQAQGLAGVHRKVAKAVSAQLAG